MSANGSARGRSEIRLLAPACGENCVMVPVLGMWLPNYDFTARQSPNFGNRFRFEFRLPSSSLRLEDSRCE